LYHKKGAFQVYLGKLYVFSRSKTRQAQQKTSRFGLVGEAARQKGPSVQVEYLVAPTVVMHQNGLWHGGSGQPSVFAPAVPYLAHKPCPHLFNSFRSPYVREPSHLESWTANVMERKSDQQ